MHLKIKESVHDRNVKKRKINGNFKYEEDNARECILRKDSVLPLYTASTVQFIHNDQITRLKSVIFILT